MKLKRKIKIAGSKYLWESKEAKFEQSNHVKWKILHERDGHKDIFSEDTTTTRTTQFRVRWVL